MIKRIDRYVGRTAILGIVATWLVLILLAMLFNLLSELRVARNAYGGADALWFVALTAPRAAYQVFPICALIGAMVSVGGLAASNELVALRTSGVSRLRIAGAALAGTLAVTIPVVTMAEFVAPAAEQQARAFRLGELIGQYVIGGPRGMWLRDGDRIVNIQRPLLTASEDSQSVEFRKLVIYDFADNGSLEELVEAESASHGSDGWQLRFVDRTRFSPALVERESVASEAWDSRLQPELVNAAVTRAPYMSMRALVRQLAYLNENGLDDSIYRSALFAKIVYPFSVLALVLAGMPFVFGSARQQRVGLRLFVGMTLGIVFSIFNSAMQNLGDAYGFPAWLSASAPTLLLAAIALLALRQST